MDKLKVALAPFLRSCPALITLGIRPGMGDYSNEERDLLCKADRIFFPSLRFVDVFQAMEKPTFPSPWTYRYQRSRVLQHTLFQYADYPHPRSRIYFGARQKSRIAQDFKFPFIALGPKVVSGTSHLVCDSRALKDCFDRYIDRYTPVVIREDVEWTDRVLLVCVCFECIGALRYSKSTSGGRFTEPVPVEHPALKEVLCLTVRLLRLARIDDIAIEWGYGNGRWQIIEMRHPPFQFDTPEAIIYRHEHICKLIQSEIL